MANCGKCNKDLSALTTKGYCLQCDMEVTKELRTQKNKLLRTIYENNFNVKLIAEITKRSENDIKEFIKTNNLKKMRDNNYTCSRCHKDTNQLFAKFDYTGLCEDCINKMVKEKAKHKTMIEPKTEVSTIENTMVVKTNQKVSEPNIEYIEPLKFKKPNAKKLDNPEPSNMITSKRGRPKKQ